MTMTELQKHYNDACSRIEELGEKLFVVQKERDDLKKKLEIANQTIHEKTMATTMMFKALGGGLAD